MKYILITFVIIFSSVLNAKTITYYSPQTNIEKIDINWLKKSQYSKEKIIYIAMYSFTDFKIAKELLNLSKHGVKIYIYRDSKQIKDRNDVTAYLINRKNIFIKLKNDKGFWNIMHLKMFIIPGIVWREGSANWSPSSEGSNIYYGNSGHSEQQDNNATFITNKKEIQQAVIQFMHIWNRSSNLEIK